MALPRRGLSKTGLGLPYGSFVQDSPGASICSTPLPPPSPHVSSTSWPTQPSLPALDASTALHTSFLVSTTEQAAKMDVADLEYLRCIQPGRSRVHLERPARDKSVVYGQMLSIKSFEL